MAAGTLTGKVLLGRFRVERFIAAGGMGVVYQVFDLKRRVPLAMKVLHAELAEDPSIFKRFKREANALKKLAHPNIVPFYGLYQTMDFAFLLEGYVDGPTLKEVLKRKGRLSAEEALTVLKGVSAALSYAHAHGVVHCDVKPGNVMLDSGGRVYLTDFGIARHAESTTTTVGFAGTPAYMAPEQIRGETVTPATDVYSLGVMAYELLVGRRPFTGVEAGTAGASTRAERLRRAHLKLEPPDPRQFNPKLPAAVANVLLRSLAKTPESRYANAWQFYEALCAALNVSPQAVGDRLLSLRDTLADGGEVTAVSAPPIPARTSSLPAPSSTIPPRRSATTWLVAASAALLFLIVIGGAAAAFALKGGWFALHSHKTIPTAAVGATAAESNVAPSVVETPGMQNNGRSVTFPSMVTLKPTNTPTIAAPTNTSLPTPTRLPTSTRTPKPTPRPTPTHVPSHAVNSADGAVWVYIPAGTFTMGLTSQQVALLRSHCNSSGCQELYRASSPAHKVSLDAFWIYQTEVSNGMYARCVAAGACTPPRRRSGASRKSYYGNPKYNNYPVTWVSWEQARTYCRWAGGRLPTSAEWEYAARGKDGRLFPWGNSFPSPSQANVNEFYNAFLPVDALPAGRSPFGLFNMTGNVWEWVQDWYSSTYYQTNTNWRNPKGPASGYYEQGAMVKVGRGGNYWIDSAISSVAIQDWENPRSANLLGVGFRCAKDGR